MKGKNFLSKLKCEKKKLETWQNETRTEISESQLIFLNRQARDILESEVKYNPDQEKYLKSIIENHRRSAKEIQRMLLFVNNDVEIKK